MDNYKSSNREVYLDNICGLLILNMIFIAHVAYYIHYYPLPLSVIGEILSFFMPWFFFKAGMVFKSKSLRKCIKTSIIRLLVPFCIFNAIGVAWDLYIAYNNAHAIGEKLHWNYLTYELTIIRDYQSSFTSLACWYLYTLFVVRILFQLLYNKIPPAFLFVVGILLNYWFYKNGNTPVIWRGSSFVPPFYLGNISFALAFYAIGYWIKDFQFNKWFFSISACLFILKFVIPSSYDERINTLHSGYYILAILYGISGCIVFNNIFKKFFNRKIMILSYMGEHSLVYYLVHFSPIMIFVYYCNNSSLGNLDNSAQFLLMVIILIFIFLLADLLYKNPKLRFIFGG